MKICKKKSIKSRVIDGSFKAQKKTPKAIGQSKNFRLDFESSKLGTRRHLQAFKMAAVSYHVQRRNIFL